MKDYNFLKIGIEEIIEKSKARVCVSFYDLKFERGFSINGEKRVPSASLIKILIMATLMKEVKNKKISLEDKISIKKEMITEGDGILKELSLDHSFSIRELMTLMIVVSDNQATNILINILEMKNINLLAEELKLEQTYLSRKMMDKIARIEKRENYCSANDISKLLKLIYQGKLIDKDSSSLMLEILFKQQQKERLQRYLPEEIKIAHKCGDLENIENDAGIIFLKNKDYILVVLVGSKDNLEGRRIIGRISKYVYDKMEE